MGSRLAFGVTWLVSTAEESSRGQFVKKTC